MSVPFRRTLANQRYATAYRSAYYGDILYDPSAALAHDPDLPQKILREPIIRQAHDHRVRSVAQREWQITPPSDHPQDVQLAQLLEWLCRHPYRLTRSLRRLAGAYLWGSVWQEKRARVRIRRLPRKIRAWAPMGEARLWVPTELVDLDRRMLRRRIVREPGKPPKLIWEMAPTFADTGKIYIPGDGRDGRWSPDDYVRHFYDADHASLGHGGGLIEAVYWFFYAKSIVIREGLQGLERWAQGWVVYKYDATKRKKKNTTNEDFIESAIAEIETHTGRKILGIASSDSIEKHDGPSTGHQMVDFFLTYFDQALTRLISGALLPLGGGADVGSNARSESEQGTLDQVTQGDQEDLAETMTRDYVHDVYWKNLPAIDALGLSDAEPGDWEFVDQTIPDPEKARGSVETAANVGLEVDIDDVHQKLQLKRPKEGEGVVLRSGAAGFDLPPGASADTGGPAVRSGGARMESGEVVAMTEILKAVSAGELAPVAAKAILRSSFDMDPVEIDEAVDGAARFSSTRPAAETSDV